jgi:hypothetical protein
MVGAGHADSSLTSILVPFRACAVPEPDTTRGFGVFRRPLLLQQISSKQISF